MENVVIGFFLWPFIGFCYVLSWNILTYFFKRHPMAYYEWYWSFTGPIVIVFDIIRKVRGIKRAKNSTTLNF